MILYEASSLKRYLLRHYMLKGEGSGFLKVWEERFEMKKLSFWESPDPHRNI
jgi:hypothetical protein